MEEELKATIKKSIQENLREESLADMSSDAALTMEPIEGAYLNHIVRVKSANGSKSCVVKVFLNYARVLGPETSLEPQRSQRENQANCYFRSLVPNCCPLPFFFDPLNNLVCLEDFPTYKTLGNALLTHCDHHAGAKLADTLVALHSSSHKDKLSGEDFSKLQEIFSPYPKQVNFLCDTHFVKPFQLSHRENKACDEAVRQKMDEILEDEVVMVARERAREWMALDGGLCCIHGDLHVNSVLFRESDGDIKLIDTECARIGPGAFDVALLVCNYILYYHYHQELSHSEAGTNKSDHAQLMTDTLDLICITMSRYMEGMHRALQDKFDKHLVWRQILLLLGVEIIAWISGPPTLRCLDEYPKAQLNCLNTALRILHRQCLSLDTKGLSILIHNQH